MPVSDATAVLAKAAIPLAVIPAYTLAVAFATQLVMLALGIMILTATGVSPSLLWSNLPLGTMTLIMIYGVTVHALWFAPVYGWLILVSAWARQSPWLWAILPFFAMFVVEWVATGKSFIAYILRYRMAGAMEEAFTGAASRGGLVTQFSQLDPARFFSSPGLWLGLAFAAACLYGAIRLRRLREPI
jgi:ABC-2 type transport system permease protein